MPQYDEWGDPVHLCTATLEGPCPVCGIRLVSLEANTVPDDWGEFLNAAAIEDPGLEMPWLDQFKAKSE